MSGPLLSESCSTSSRMSGSASSLRHKPCSCGPAICDCYQAREPDQPLRSQSMLRLLILRLCLCASFLGDLVDSSEGILKAADALSQPLPTSGITQKRP